MKAFHKYFIFFIIFINGYKLILPLNISDDNSISTVSIPLWATNFNIAGVYLSDFLFIVYFLFFGIKYRKSIFKGKFSLLFFYLITFLSIAGFISTLLNFEIFTDYFEAVRLFTLALFFLCVVWWTNLYGEINILRIFVIGLIVSGLINLYFTFFYSVRLIGGLPQLLGQNGPGGAAGFLMFIGAWFFHVSDAKKDKIISVLLVIEFSFVLIISYSKLGMLMGAFGLIAFFVVIFFTPDYKTLWKRISILMVCLFTFLFWVFKSEKGQILIEGTSAFFFYKFGTEGAGIIEKEGGDEERMYYYLAVGEVFINNPFFGVGYNGFGPAVSKTKAHSSGKMSAEGSFVNANPHNAFLYYISANGILGWIIAATIYIIFLFVFFLLFKDMKVHGFIFFICLMTASIIHVNTLIGFFNTTIMYLPTAVAVSMLQRKRFKRLNY